MTIRKQLVSIICPVHNDAVCVPLFYERLSAALSGLWASYDFELIFMNNCSTDATLVELLKIRAANPWVQVISLSRNFGYEPSLICGIRNSVGDAVIFIDVDCEDPPEMIPQFLAEWQNGYEVVYGQRTNRPENAMIVSVRKWFYRFTRLIADYDFVLDMAEFSLISARVRDVCLHNNSTAPFIRNEIGYAGFRRLGIPYRRQKRVAGETHYNFLRLIQFALTGILTSSTFPLRFTVYLGIPLCLVNLIALFATLVGGPLNLQPLLLANLTLLVVAAGAISLFIARLYKDVVRRPLFIVDPDQTTANRPVVDDTGQRISAPRQSVSALS